ncbi:MAG: restriction endonuclease subunit S [Acetobacter sp.]|nr:restriction endonuclease subunit S [Acetobacter sp.]
MSKCKIKEFVTQLRGVSYKPTDVTDATNGIPILRANNIQDDGMVYDDLIYVKSEKVKQAQKLQAGDIVICTSSGSKALVGKASIFTGYSKVISFGAFCKALRINDVVGINKDFIRVFFSSKLYREQIASSSIGANINNIKSENIDDLNINIPTPEVQSAAVEILTQLNKAILSKKEQLKQLDELVKSRFIEMFGDLLYDNKSQVSLKNCTKFIDYRGKTPEKCSMGIRLITAKNVRMHNLNFEPAEFIPEENFDKIMTRGFPKSGDILFTTEAPLGYVCVIPEMKEKFCVGQRLITIVPDERINSIYLEYFMSSEYFQDKIWRNSSGSTVKGIKSRFLEKLFVSIAEKSKQNTFAEFVKQVDKSKFIVQKQIDDLQELLDSKMDEYFG